MDLEQDVAILQRTHNEQREHIMALTHASGQTRAMVDAQSFKHNALRREMESWMEVVDKDARVLSRTCLGLSGRVMSRRSRRYSPYLRAIMADRPRPATDSDEEENWGSMSSSRSSSPRPLPHRSRESCLRVLDDPMDSDEGASGGSSLVASGTREDPIELDSEDEGSVVQRVVEVSDSSNGSDDLYE